MSVEALFADFYEQITGASLSAEGMAAFAAVVNDLQCTDQEVKG